MRKTTFLIITPPVILIFLQLVFLFSPETAAAASSDLSFLDIGEQETLNTIDYKIAHSPFAMFEPMQLPGIIKGDLPLSEASLQVNESSGESPAEASGVPGKLISLIKKIYQQEKSTAGEGGNILQCLTLYPKDAPTSMFCGASKLYFSNLTKNPLIFNICVKKKNLEDIIKETRRKFGSPSSEEPYYYWLRKNNILFLWPQSTRQTMYSIYFSNNINEHLKQLAELYPRKPL